MAYILNKAKKKKNDLGSQTKAMSCSTSQNSKQQILHMTERQGKCHQLVDFMSSSYFFIYSCFSASVIRGKKITTDNDAATMQDFTFWLFKVELLYSLVEA